MKLKNYIHLDNGNSLLLVGRSGSTATTLAICKELHPEVLPKTRPLEIEGARWPQELLGREESPVGDVIVPVRNPVERFQSWCNYNKATPAEIDEALSLVENDSENFAVRDMYPVTKLIPSGARTLLFKFPDHLPAMASDIGISEIPIENESDEDVTINQTQIDRFTTLFKDDIALYESITEAGQTYTAPPEPATAELKAAKIRELESARYQSEIAGITLPTGQFVRTDKETQAELGKALSIISTVNPTLEIDWKFPDGEVVHMDSTQIQQIAGAVFTHVQSTRTAYKDKAALVEAATTKDELNSITW